jgi:hypothetical protein
MLTASVTITAETRRNPIISPLNRPTARPVNNATRTKNVSDAPGKSRAEM